MMDQEIQEGGKLIAIYMGAKEKTFCGVPVWLNCELNEINLTRIGYNEFKIHKDWNQIIQTLKKIMNEALPLLDIKEPENEENYNSMMVTYLDILHKTKYIHETDIMEIYENL